MCIVFCLQISLPNKNPNLIDVYNLGLLYIIYDSYNKNSFI